MGNLNTIFGDNEIVLSEIEKEGMNTMETVTDKSL